MVADALEVSDYMQQLGDFPAFFHRQIFAGQPDQIGAQFVLIHIDLVFAFLNGMGDFFIISTNYPMA